MIKQKQKPKLKVRKKRKLKQLRLPQGYYIKEIILKVEREKNDITKR